MKPETRVYPVSCLSWNCGKTRPQCNPSCPYWCHLNNFENWVDEHDAIVVDSIHAPNVYTSQKED
jgi:hypothetical protein